MSTTVQLSEIFSSFQGEGPYVGARQIFVRFAGCNLSCQYCDTVLDSKLTVSADELLKLICDLNKPAGVVHSICLTGGEPLLQVDFIKQFIPIFKKEFKLPLYLETNGVLPDHLAEILDLVDIIVMDIKLPSAAGVPPFWKEHKKMLEIARAKELFVKIIITRETRPAEMIEAVSLMAAVDENIPLVLQPVTPHGPIKHRPSAEQLFSFHAIAARKLKTVRVIPQMHKILGVS
jgi:organic radical activating enzyme